jgi:hypothetical protein
VSSSLREHRDRDAHKFGVQGTLLAERLYRDAIMRGRMAEDPLIPLSSLPDHLAPYATGNGDFSC